MISRFKCVCVCNPKTKETIISYLNICESRQRKGRKGLVAGPIISSEMDSRSQIDLIDMQTQPDGDYKFICVYQDYLTTFVILRPLREKSAKEVGNVQLDTFTILGIPAILQSDNGREFGNEIISKLYK